MARWRMLMAICLLPVIAPVMPLAAQGDAEACPVLVEEALAQVGEACEGLRRNEACYGHAEINATTWQQAPLGEFAVPGDTASVVELASLTTLPMNVEAGTWGVAVLALQADLPDTLPGQNVTFVLYGDVELRSEGEPPAEPPPVTCEAAATTGVNVRAGPGTGYGLVGSLSPGQTATVTGRNEAGDWLRVALDEAPGRGWSAASLLTPACEVETLAPVEDIVVVEPASPYPAPMQAFSLTIGLGEPACREAPRDGLLVQAPRETVVHFLVNGVELLVGSTAVVQQEGERLGVNTLDGVVEVTSQGVTRTAGPGLRVDVVPGEAPAAPVPYDRDDVRHAPVELLPERVRIPGPASAIHYVEIHFGLGACVTDNAQPIDRALSNPVSFGWGLGCFDSAASANAHPHAAAYQLYLDGAPMDMSALQQSGPNRHQPFCPWGWNYFMPPQDLPPGEHQIAIVQTILDGWQDASGGFQTGAESRLGCTLTVAP